MRKDKKIRVEYKWLKRKDGKWDLRLDGERIRVFKELPFIPVCFKEINPKSYTMIRNEKD